MLCPSEGRDEETMRLDTRAAFALLALGALPACPDNTLSAQDFTDVFRQSPQGQVDILFVIDNSQSMVEEQEAVAENFVRMINQMEETNTDWHIGVVTTDMYDPDQRGRLVTVPADPDDPNSTPIKVLTSVVDNYNEVFSRMVQVGTTGSRLERGLDAARAAVTPPLATHDNAGLMRNDAGLAIVIVSDENDCSDSGAIGGNESDDCAEHASLLTPVETYVETFRDLKPDSNDVVFAAVVGNEGSDEVGACPNASPGIRYLWTAELLGGVILPICDPFEDIMDTLGLSVSGIRDRFLLSHHAAVETITVEVQPESGEAYEEQPRGDDPTARGWTYDEASGFLIFWNEAVPARGAQITVTYRISSGPTTATG